MARSTVDHCLTAIDCAGKATRIQLRERIGKESGEGEIWRLYAPGELAKLYISDSNQELRAAKLRTMVQFPPRDPSAPVISIAWPKRLVLDDAGQVIGFTLPEIDKAEHPALYFNARLRKKHYPAIDWYYLHVAALNIAKVCRAVHQGGNLVGDLKADNWLIHKGMTAVIIDTDSFQIRHPETSVVYRCLVATDEYCAPELRGKECHLVDRAPEHDNFAIAVLIYQMLFGAHPFSGGEYLGQGDPPNETGQRIEKGQWLWQKGGVFRPSTKSLPLTILHPGLVELMRRAFDDGQKAPHKRPSPEDWESALAIAIESLAWCDAETMHVYSQHENTCSWCQHKVASGNDPFPSTPNVPSLSFHVQIGKFKNAVREGKQTGNYRKASGLIDKTPRLLKEQKVAEEVTTVLRWRRAQLTLWEHIPKISRQSVVRGSFAASAAVLAYIFVAAPALFPEKPIKAANAPNNVEPAKRFISKPEAQEKPNPQALSARQPASPEQSQDTRSFAARKPPTPPQPPQDIRPLAARQPATLPPTSNLQPPSANSMTEAANHWGQTSPGSSPSPSRKTDPLVPVRPQFDAPALQIVGTPFAVRGLASIIIMKDGDDIDLKAVHLFGIKLASDETSRRNFRNYLGQKALQCSEVRLGQFRCLIKDTGVDVAKFALAVGLASTTPEAPQTYRDAEARAQQFR